LSLVLLSATLLVLPVGAQAQVVADPNSPAGKEYAIPLDQARENGSGSGGGDQGGANSASFGEGISRPGDDAKKGSSKNRSSNDRQKNGKDGSSRSDELDTAGSIGGGSGGSGGGPDEAGADGALLTSGIALAVLLLGGGIAFLMRRGAFGTDA
jgi:hypothetical protein